MFKLLLRHREDALGRAGKYPLVALKNAGRRQWPRKRDFGMLMNKGRPPGRRVRIAFRGSLFCLRDAPLAVISHRLTFGSSPAGTARLLVAGRLRLLSNQNARRACPPLYRSQSHCIRSACHRCLWNVPRPPRMKGLHTEVQIVHSSVSASPRQIPACDCCWYGAIAVGTYYSTVVPKLGRVNCVRRTKG